MSRDTQIVEILIRDINRADPRLAQALKLINDKLENLDLQLNPLILQSILDVAIESAVVAPLSFTSIFTPRTIRLNWTTVDGASQYEIRKGTVWETATFQLRSVSLQADIDPLLIGSHTFLIKSVTRNGTYSTDATSLTFDIPTIPPVVVTATVIDNNVLLLWTPPISTFLIKHYIITKNGLVIGTQFGSFFATFESVAGTYEYQITSVDIAGNQGANTVITVEVNQPPDFQLEAEQFSFLSASRVNMWERIIEPTGPFFSFLIGPWLTRTYRQHFVDNGWNTIQDQIDAGYPIYLQPSSGVGTYEEVFDFSVVFTNIIATVTYNFIQVDPLSVVTVLIEMATSLDDLSYSAFTSGASQFFSTFRYLKVKFTFTRTDAHSLIRFYNLQVRLDVKREQDGGTALCTASDVTGTEILFNRAFKDIDTISASAIGTEYSIVIINFVDVPNPVSFRALVFDAAGVRKTRDVLWIARGIV